MDPRLTTLEMSPPAGESSDLSAIVRQSLELALAGTSKVSPEILDIPGMSGRRYRYFINNLMERLAAPRYLEIGSWAGSTLCSALYGNKVDAVAVDNWSLFGGPADQFFTNLAAFKGASTVSFLEKDFRAIDFTTFGATFGKFNVYLFDGPHDFIDQYDGVMLAQPVLEQRNIQIVDDWNWSAVREGTQKAIADLGLRTEFRTEIRTSMDETAPEPPPGGHKNSDWHNGYFIAVLSRPS